MKLSELKKPVLKIVLRAAAAGLFVLLIFLISLHLKSPAGLAAAIARRSYRTESEQIDLALISGCAALAVCLFLTVASLCTALAEEEKEITFASVLLITAAFYLWACLDGYKLLNNGFITALLITGKYTMRLLLSIVNIAAGWVGESVQWESSILWYTICACLFVCPFAIAGTALGKYNFWKIFLVSAGFGGLYFGSHYLLAGGALQIVLALLFGALAGGCAAYFMSRRGFGTVRKTKKEPVISISVSNRLRTVFLIAGAALWALTVLLGRVKSFSSLMRLVFGSDLFKYQKEASALNNTGIARTLLISYLISLLIRELFRRISINDEARFSGFLVASYMLLVQIWILPLLSSFLYRASEGVKIDVTDGDLNNAAGTLKDSASGFMDFAHSNLAGAALLGCIILGILVVVMFIVLAVNLTVFRYIISFLAYFSICMYVYSLIVLFFGTAPDTYVTMILCYLMNRLVSRLLSVGPAVRERFGAAGKSAK
jgi:hypothetical protein